MSSHDLSPGFPHVRAASVFADPGARPAQEDCFLMDRDKGIFVIADGFGGPAPGAGAARAACDAVKSFLVKQAGDQDATMPFELRSYFSLAGNILFNSLVHANRKVLNLNQGKAVHERGGASVLAGYLDESLLALANVGACTAWLFRDGEGAELVAPRTWGRLMDPVRRDAPGTSRLPLMALGTAPDLEPEVVECRIQSGDWLVLATAGFDPVLREQIATAQKQGMPAGEASEQALQAIRGYLGSGNPGEIDDNSSISLIIF